MTPEALGHLEVWLLTGSQEMYGAGWTLRPGRGACARDRNRASTPHSLTFRCAWFYRDVTTSPGFDPARAALDANAADTCIA